jgi:ketosteroid isomerase-like protein
MSANLDLVRSILADWERGEWESRDWADPDIEFARADGPAPGSWRGFAEVAGAIREMLSAWEDMRVMADRYMEIDGERVLVFVRMSGRGKRSGVEAGQLRAEAAELFQVRGGKVIRVITYYDRDRALADLGLGPEAAG